jgi:hypothetical protein
MTPEQLDALQALESEPPSMREELERKVAEEIERVYLAARAGKITSYGYHQALQGLWGGVAGLVSRESMEIITASQKEFPGGLTEKRRAAFILGEVTAVVSWEVGTTTIETALKKPGSPAVVQKTKMEDDSAASALVHFLKTTKRFRDMPGAQEV